MNIYLLNSYLNRTVARSCSIRRTSPCVQAVKHFQHKIQSCISRQRFSAAHESNKAIHNISVVVYRVHQESERREPDVTEADSKAFVW